MKALGGHFDPFMQQMERALDVMARRQGLIASNVGNIDTPGYKAVDLDFKAALADAVGRSSEPSIAMRATRPGHLDAGPLGAAAPLARRVTGLAVRNDGNDVSIDQEMMNLAETTGKFEATAQMLRLRLRQLMYAVTDGRSG